MSMACGPIVPVRMGNVTDGEPSENWIVAVGSVIGRPSVPGSKRRFMPKAAHLPPACERDFAALIDAFRSPAGYSLIGREASRRTARAPDRRCRPARSIRPTAPDLSYGEGRRDLQCRLRSAH